MSLVEKINKQHVIYFIIAIAHFLVVFVNTPSFTICNSLEQKINFFFVKSISLILIILFWQFVSFLVNTIKNDPIEQKTNYKISFVRYFFIYLILNLIVLALTYPVQLYEQSYLYNISSLRDYSFDYHPNWLQSFNVYLGYHFVPFIVGVSLFNSILYSIVFAYCVASVQKVLNNKLYYLIFIPFCFPYVFVLNQLPIRMVLCAWLFVFVASFILFNKNKECSNFIKTILFSIVAGLLASIRSEYIVLIVLIPLFVYSSKVFKLRNFLVFILIFFMSFFFCILKQEKSVCFHYELHNLSYIYDAYLLGNFEDNEIDESSHILRDIYKKSFEKSNLASTVLEYEISNKENIAKAIFLLLKFPLKHPLYFLEKNISSMNISNEDILYIDLFEMQAKSEPYLKSIIPETFLDDYSFQHKVVYLLLNLNIENKSNIFSKYLYNPKLSLFFILFSLFVGIFKRQMFFIWNFVVWILILLLILIYMYWPVPHYYYAFVINSWYVFILCIISLLKKQPCD